MFVHVGSHSGYLPFPNQSQMYHRKQQAEFLFQLEYPESITCQAWVADTKSLEANPLTTQQNTILAPVYRTRRQSHEPLAYLIRSVILLSIEPKNSVCFGPHHQNRTSATPFFSAESNCHILEQVIAR